MNGFGDLDPDDVYDAGDPVLIRLVVLERVVPSVLAERVTDGLTVRNRIRGRWALGVLGDLGRTREPDPIVDDLIADLRTAGGYG